MVAHAWMAFHNMAFWLMILFWGLIVGGSVFCLMHYLRTPRFPTGPGSKDGKETSYQERSSPL